MDHNRYILLVLSIGSVPLPGATRIPLSDRSRFLSVLTQFSPSGDRESAWRGEHANKSIGVRRVSGINNVEARGRTCWTGTRSYTCLCTTLRFFFLMFVPPFQTLSSLSRGCGFLCKSRCFIYLYLPRTRHRSLHMKWREITWNFVTGNVNS